MHTLATWDPFRELDDFSSRLSTIFHRNPSSRSNRDNDYFTANAWAPLVDITEDDKEYLIRVELSGVEKSDVKITVEKGVLTIGGERKAEHHETKDKVHRVERAYGSFRRSFTVPDDADGDKISADYKNGVLTVHLPKAPETQPKQIAIKVA